MSGGRLDHGRVEIPLVGETLELQPTIEAMLDINRKYGDLQAAARRVQAIDFEAIVFILSAGYGRKAHAHAGKDLAQAVFDTGVVNLVVPTATYLSALMSPSGRDLELADEGKG